MILRRKAYKMSLENFDPRTREEIQRRSRTKAGREITQEINKETHGQESAVENVLGGAMTKREIKQRQREIRQAGNDRKINNLIG